MEKEQYAFFFALCIACVSGASYLISAPRTIIRGTNYGVAVDILNYTGVALTVELHDSYYNYTTRRNEVYTLKTVQNTFSAGKTGLVSIPIEDTFNCRSCQLHVRGRGGLQFERQVSVRMANRLVTILIQTDKAIYKPGQRVRFRALAVYPDLKIYKGKFHIEIKDPSNRKIKIISSIASPSGVVEGNLDLSDQPPFGDWSIVVTDMSASQYTTVQRFTVADYALPRFAVTIELPPYQLTNQLTLTGTVKAKYTFGQPVKGRVELHVGPDSGGDYCGRLPATVQSSFEIDGEAKFTVQSADLRRVVSLYQGSRVRVTAIVKEATTGIRLNGSSVVEYYNTDYSVKFLENSPSVFKPGLPYNAYVQVETPDNRPPPTNLLDQVHVHAYATYRVSVQNQSMYGMSYFTGSYALPGYTMALPSNGVLPIRLEIPNNATSITINVRYKSQSVRKTVSKSNSNSNNYVQLSLESKNLKAGDTAKCKLLGTEPLNAVTIQILSRGSLVKTFNLDGHAKTSVNFDLPVTAKMAPTAHLLAYYKRQTTEIVADSIAFQVDGIFENKVSLSYNVGKTEPHKEVDLTVKADPDSTVNLLAVDQSVLLLKSGNDITPDKIEDAVSAYDNSRKPSDSEFALAYSAANTREVFRQMDLVMMTDVPVSRSPPIVEHDFVSDCLGGNPAAGMRPPNMPMPTPAPGIYGTTTPTFAPGAPISGKGPLKDVEHVRKIFPEAWLWTSHNVSSSGQTTIKSIVPDTITSWVTSAFATNDVSGLGVAPTTAKLTVFRPFFVSLTYPSAVTRNEQAVIQVTVFNYLPTNTTVFVTMKQSSHVQSLQIAANGTETMSSDDQQQTLTVSPGKQGVVYFPVVATLIGVADIEITAQTAIAADGVKRQMTIQAEGAPVSFNYPIYVNLDNVTTNYIDSLTFTTPGSLVSGSEVMRIKVSGDLLGPSVNNLESLLAMPTGCGEQSMVKFAPDLYIAQYLKSSGQFDDYWNQRITALLSAGYQRELTYQRRDGGFSAFGDRDEAGSTWLTAFVSRTFYEARDFIYVDPDVIIKTVNWLLDRQNKDGSFSEFGTVLDHNTQGSHSGPSLTAYVVLTLLQTKGVFNDKYNQYKLGNATLKAVKNLESVADSITDDFSLAVVSYALSEAGSNTNAFAKLQSKAIDAGGLQYWSSKTTVPSSSPRVVPYGSRYTLWTPSQPQARPVDILTTAYGVLSYASQGRLGEGLPAMRWLIKQRSARGGFASTQDTTVALQALAKYAMKSHRPATDLKVKVTGDAKETLDFDVTLSNSLVLQTKEYNASPSKLDIVATGKGLALVEIDQSFNVDAELTTSSFDVSPVLLDDDLDSFNLMICTKWLWDRKTGMVVQEIGIPSGFNPDLSTLGNVVGMKRSERRGNTVAIYFDEIGKTSVCYSLLMTRASKVAKSEKSFIRTYDYYNPVDQSTVFYQPRSLKESTVCDVCKGCCP